MEEWIVRPAFYLVWYKFVHSFFFRASVRCMWDAGDEKQLRDTIKFVAKCVTFW